MWFARAPPSPSDISIKMLPAVPVDEIGLKTGTDPSRIYLHSKNEKTLVLSTASKLFHGACSRPLELIAHQYCLVRVGRDNDLSVHSTRSERRKSRTIPGFMKRQLCNFCDIILSFLSLSKISTYFLDSQRLRQR